MTIEALTKANGIKTKIEKTARHLREVNKIIENKATFCNFDLIAGDGCIGCSIDLLFTNDETINSILNQIKSSIENNLNKLEKELEEL